MIFKQVQEIKDRRKTQTRRVVKNGEWAMSETQMGIRILDAVCSADGRIKHMVGRSYAIVPKRGAASVGRIVINRIDQERLQDITEADARAEGVGSVAEYQTLWETINKTPGTRWDDNPLVWVYSFSYIDIPF